MNAANLDELPDGEVDWALSMPLLLRHLADDLRTFYHESIAAQPDHLIVANTLSAKFVRGFPIPEGYYQGGSAFPKSKEFGQ